MYLSLYCKGLKGLSGVLLWEGAGDWTELQYILTPLLWPSALCLSRSPGLLNRRPRGSALCWMIAFFTASYQQLLWTPTHLGAPRTPSTPFSLVWLSLPHLVSISNSNWSLTVLTELYNSSTPTQSLEWHVWSSSSGNNCHAVQRSLSSGVSVYECIMGFFTLSHFISQFPPTRFPLITAIGMCHFLPVHHLGMASLAGSKVKIQHYYQDLLKTACSILMLFPFSFFSNFFMRFQVVKLYNNTHTVTAWKSSWFVLSVRSDFHLVDNQSIVVHTLCWHYF